MERNEAFVRKFWPLAADVGLRYGVHPATILAVGAQESLCGTSFSARTRRNYFGLGGPGRWLRFESDAACFEYFGQLLARRYEAAVLVSADPVAFAQRMSRTNYVAESPAAKAQWGRNVVAYWHRFVRLAAAHGLRPAGPLLAQSSTTPNRA